MKFQNCHRLVSLSQQRFCIHEIKIKSYPSSNTKICFQSPNYHDYIIPCSLREYMPANDKLTELKLRKVNLFLNI